MGIPEKIFKQVYDWRHLDSYAKLLQGSLKQSMYILLPDAHPGKLLNTNII